MRIPPTALKAGIGPCLVLALCLLAAAPAGATFPGANGLIAFESFGRDGPDADVFTIAPDGTGLTNLTAASPTADRYPFWSADGAKIAFVSERDGGDFDVWVMNADGSGATRDPRQRRRGALAGVVAGRHAAHVQQQHER